MFNGTSFSKKKFFFKLYSVHAENMDMEDWMTVLYLFFIFPQKNATRGQRCIARKTTTCKLPIPIWAPV